MKVRFKKADASDSANITTQTTQVIDPYERKFARIKLLAICIISIIAIALLFYNLIVSKDKTDTEKFEVVSKILSSAINFRGFVEEANTTNGS